MPKRFIKGPVFQYRSKEGPLVVAYRGEEHDIPEGEDLERGDKFGAFTPDGKPPRPPDDTFLPDIDVDWSPAEFERFIDAATESEAIDKLNHVSDENRAAVARSLIEAEEARGETARSTLLEALVQVAESPSSPSTPEPEGEGAGETTGEGEGEDLVEFVATSTIPDVLARAGEDPETAAALREAEESRGDKARSTLIEQLSKIETPTE